MTLSERYEFVCPYCGASTEHRTQIGGIFVAFWHFHQEHPKLSETVGDPRRPETGPTVAAFERARRDVPRPDVDDDCGCIEIAAELEQRRGE